MLFKKSEILTIVLFIALLVCTAIAQTELKQMPQLVMMAFGLITLMTHYLQAPFNKPILFNIQLGVMVFILVFVLCSFVTGLLNPEDGKIIDSEGKVRHVMATNWIWAGIYTIIFTPVILVLYHKKLPRNILFEKWLTILFLLITVIIFFLYEVI